VERPNETPSQRRQAAAITNCAIKTPFKVVDRPKEVQVIHLMWTFVYKYDTEGYLTKYKSRVVARGDLQQNGLQDTYLHRDTFCKAFRAMMVIAAYFRLEAYQWDITNAFVNAAMDEEVFVEFPPNKAILLQKALSGLRWSPRLWHKTFIAIVVCQLAQMGERSVFFLWNAN
jgi:reverse transcriptase-like protein